MAERMVGCKSSACVNEKKERKSSVERVAGKTKAKPAEKLRLFRRRSKSSRVTSVSTLIRDCRGY